MEKPFDWKSKPMDPTGCTVADTLDEIWAQVMAVIRHDPYREVTLVVGTFLSIAERDAFMAMATPDLLVFPIDDRPGCICKLKYEAITDEAREKYWAEHKAHYVMGGESYWIGEMVSYRPMFEIPYFIWPRERKIR